MMRPKKYAFLSLCLSLLAIVFVVVAEVWWRQMDVQVAEIFELSYPTAYGFGGYDYVYSYYLRADEFRYDMLKSGSDVYLQVTSTNGETAKFVLPNGGYLNLQLWEDLGLERVASNQAGGYSFVAGTGCNYMVIELRTLEGYGFTDVNSNISIPVGAALVDEHQVVGGTKKVAPLVNFYCTDETK